MKQAPTPLDDFCVYCDRVRWGNYQPLTQGKWRHLECFPGSLPWCEWYENQPRRTDYGDAMFRHTMKREPAAPVKSNTPKVGGEGPTT